MNTLFHFNSLGIADFFDVLIVTILLYIIIMLFKQTRSSLVLGGVGVLVGISVVAKIFELSLTLFALNIFFGAFFIMLAIIFQEELRRFFAFLALLSTRHIKQKRPLAAASPLVEEIAHTATNLAYKKIGGLMVFPGNETIEHFLEGGKILDGVISQELIESIFDPSSPGHDGAMIIQRDRIAQFAVHLPLSKNLKELKGRGTRHSAALGITERSDALCVVISEERGKISTASHGKLKELLDEKELAAHLNTFLKEKFPEQSRRAVDYIIKKNSFEKVVALASAVLFKLLLNR
jgi:uncharacterized protein (TIGR00159 family)